MVDNSHDEKLPIIITLAHSEKDVVIVLLQLSTNTHCNCSTVVFVTSNDTYNYYNV